MKKLCLFGILVFALFACNNEIDEMNNGNTAIDPSMEIINEYNPESDLLQGSIFGRVYNEQEDPIANAQVKYNGKNYTTDQEGRFFIIDEVLDKKGTFFTVEAEGYFKGSRRINPQEGSVNYAYVQLLELNSIGILDATTGGEVNIQTSGSNNGHTVISFPANSFALENGDLYSGEVTIAAKYLDPTALNISEIMPGNLLGLNNLAEEVSLVSYGMMAVELFGENGEKLNIAAGQTATLSFPIPVNLLDSAPEEIPLWSFEEEEYGIWVEEEVATLQNGMYIGEVSHFTFWSIYVPFGTVFIEGQLLTPNGSPLINTRVNLFINNNVGVASGSTDDSGFFAGNVPKGTDLTLSLVRLWQNDCEFSSINLGSFDMEENIGPVMLQESGEIFTISGTLLNCENNLVENGLIHVEVGNSSTEFYLGEETEFELNLLNCANEDEVSITAVDIDNIAAGLSTSKSIESIVEFGEISTCGDELPEFFTLTVGENSATMIEDIKASMNYTQTFVGIQVGDVWDSIPGKFVITLLLDNGAVGTYGDRDFDFIDLITYPADFNEYSRLACTNPCTAYLSSFTLIIEENSGPGGHIAGEFNGKGTFKDINDSSIPDEYPFSGSFRLPIN